LRAPARFGFDEDGDLAGTEMIVFVGEIVHGSLLPRGVAFSVS
jgi:hypothetical protein